MRHGFLKVAAATPTVAVNNTTKNSSSIIKQIKLAAKNGAKLVVFPELCLSGYSCGDLFLQSDIVTRCKLALSQILKETSDLDVLFAIGMPVLYMDKLYNAAAVCKSGRVLGFVPKTHLPNYLAYGEVRYFSTLSKTVDVDFDGYSVPMGTKLIFCAKEMPELRVACELCEDMWVTNPPSNNHAQNGATIILNLSATDETPGKRAARKLMVASNSVRQISAYVYADAGDGESTTDVVYAGNNMIYECGKCLAEAEPFENEIVYAVVDTQKLSQVRKQKNTFVNNTDEDYRYIYFNTKIEDTSLASINKTPFVPKSAERLDHSFKMQCKGLEKRLRHIGAKSVVIGVSGGLDSTLALLVAAKCFDDLGLDRKGIISVSMPCFGTSDRTYNNSKKLAEILQTTYREISIAKAVTQHFEDIGASADDYDVTFENAQARERTQVLMDIANKTGGIVVGTGDLSELALGFATYNGDHMSMYGVNSSIPKTLMREMVKRIGDTWGGELKSVLYDVVETPVSPELLPPDTDGKINQKTEDIVGPYEVHDFILYYFVRYGFDRTKILRMAKNAFEGVYSEEMLDKWFDIFYRRFYSNQFKRSASPDGVKASAISLSQRGAWNMPSDAELEI